MIDKRRKKEVIVILFFLSCKTTEKMNGKKKELQSVRDGCGLKSVQSVNQ